MTMTTAHLARIPNCDICGEPAKYDSPINYNGRVTWAYTCEEHHESLKAGNMGSVLVLASGGEPGHGGWK